jgi:two-component system, OmpR family, phosphate regulon sensor histidine kinase PhoR
MTRPKWLFNSIFVISISIIASVTSLFLYIYWYIEVSTGLKGAVAKFNLDAGQIFTPQTWVVILVLSLLVGIIMLGILTIFIYGQKTWQLYRLQQNFINNFTHELKTPVTSLNLYLETFLKYDLPREDRRKYVGYMLADVSRLTGHVNRILNLAKIESKSYGKEFVRLDLEEATRRFLRKNQHIFNTLRISINTPHKGPFYYRVDLSLFEMLLMNLVTNAIKYNQSEVPRLDITFWVEGRKLQVQFADNGIGFEKSEIKKIFKKFYQVGRSDDMTAKGSGLGLHLVQHIARIHKGKMMAHSHGHGKGSTFTLTLPWIKGSA